VDGLRQLWLEFIVLPEIEFPKLPFEQWKQLLREDCVRLDILASFKALDDGTLRALWLDGLKPYLISLVENEQLRRSLRTAA
jgi:hypothetical protein